MRMIHHRRLRFFAALLMLGLTGFLFSGCETQEKQTSVIPHKKMKIGDRDNKYQRNPDSASDNDPATTNFLR